MNEALQPKVKVSKAKIIEWVASVLATIIILLIPTNEVFTQQIRTFLAIVLFYILLTAFDLVPAFVIAIGMPVTFKIFNIASSSVIFGGWTGNTPFVALGCLALAVALEEVGLLNRISLWVIQKLGGTYRGAVMGVFVAALLCSCMTSCCVNYVFAAFAYGVCRTLGLQKGKAATVVMCAASIGTLTSQAVILYPPATGLLFTSGSTETMTLTESWIGYIIHNWPMIIMLLGMMFFLTRIYTRDVKIKSTKQDFIDQYKALGPMTAAEKKASVYIILTLLYLLSTVFTGMSSDWPFLIVPVLFFVPVIGIVKPDCISKINFTMVFLISAFIAVGNCANALGLGQLVGDLLLPYFSNAGTTGVIGLTFLTGTAFNFLLTPFAMYSAFSGPLSQIAVSLGINPVAVLHSLLLTGDSLVLPYENLCYLVYFGFGMMTMKDFAKIYGFKIILTAVVLLVVLVPWWSVCGFLGI